MEIKGYAGEKLRTTRLIISDVDGTLARRILIDSEGKDIKVFCEKDGYMIIETVRAGVAFVMLSGRDSKATRVRADGLKIPFFTREEVTHSPNSYSDNPDSCSCDPLKFFEKKYNVGRQEIMYIGDGWLDLWWMVHVGVAVAPADADPECRAVADIVTEANGGEGVIAEVLAEVLKARGVYEDILQKYFLSPS